MQKNKVETERLELQSRLDALLKNGAECIVKDGDTLVTSFYLDSFEVLLPQPFFDRLTGELSKLTWWCWFREMHFEAAMQRSHLVHVNLWEWIDGRNLRVQTDDYVLLISTLDPPEVDPVGGAVQAEWREFKRENPWLKDVSRDLRESFLQMARRAVG